MVAAGAELGWIRAVPCAVLSAIPMASLPPFSSRCFLPPLLFWLWGSVVLASSVWLFKHQSPEHPSATVRTGEVGMGPGGGPGSLRGKAAR